MRVTGAVAVRVLAQLRRDPRTIALIVGVPCLLETLLKELFAGRSPVFQHVGAPLLGLFVSAFAQTEFQAVQFMPAMVFPQILLCGLFVGRGAMATWLRWISDALPLTYAYDALAHTAADTLDGRFAPDVAVVCGCILLALGLGAATLRRRTA